MPHLIDGLTWRSSSDGSGNCVEVAAAAAVFVRDSKHPDGPNLSFSAGEWRRLAAQINSGAHDLH